MHLLLHIEVLICKIFNIFDGTISLMSEMEVCKLDSRYGLDYEEFIQLEISMVGCRESYKVEKRVKEGRIVFLIEVLSR